MTLGYFAGDMGHITYTFRFQNGRFELIGYDRINVTRNSGVMTKRERQLFDAAHGTHVLATFRTTNDKVTRTKLPRKPLLTLPEVGDGLDFEPLSK